MSISHSVEAPHTLRLGFPGAHPEVLERRHLVDVLRRGARGPLTLLSAPAGYGKTVLVQSWVSAIDASVPVAQMTMREDDRSQVVFWGSAIESLRSAGVDVYDVLAPAAAEGVDGAMMAGLIRGVNARRTPVVWVLDCSEFVLSPSVGQGLHRLIEGCPEHLRLVLLTRADPPLPLHRYRLSGTLTEIRAAELAFSASEAGTLLHRAGLDLAPLDAVMLRSRTGGWPAGLQFAAMALAGRVDIEEAIGEFRGDSGNVAAYLTREVYTKQPPSLQRFLLRTCLVDEVSPRLATALTGQDCEAGALQFVASGNTFMEPVPGRPGWYRYQSLFREFLRSQLSFEHPELKPQLHRAAAEQLAEDGLILPALQHAVAAGAWSLATRFLVDGLWFGGLLVGGHRTLLRDLFAAIPPDLEGAEASLTRAALALVDNDRDACDKELDTARRLLDEGSAARRGPSALATSILSAVSATLGGDLEEGLVRVLAAEAALLAAPPEARHLHPDLLALLARSKATALVEQGELSSALETLEEGMAAASATHLGDVLEELQGMAALVHAVNGDLRQAERIALRLAPGGLEDTSGWARVPRTAVAALAWARMDQYDLQEAHALVRLAEDSASSFDSGAADGVLSLVRARLLAADGRLELAHSTVRAAQVGVQPGGASSWLQRAHALAEARLLLAQGRPSKAAEVARVVTTEDHLERDLVLRRALLAEGGRPPALAEPSSRTLERVPLEVRVDVWLALTEQCLEGGDHVGGEACLEQALRVAAPERLRRPFLEAGPDVRALLERRSLSGRARWLHPEAPLHPVHTLDADHGQVHRSSVNPDAVREEPLVNPLTKKELEVLGHLAELLTTEEIAEAMYVSVNTVRSHVRNILRKLGVARRNEAVRRAWDLQLLPPPNVA